MYKITFNNGNTEYFEDVVFIKKQANGYFAPATPEEATGVCLKLQQTGENENGEEQTWYCDTPFLFEEAADYKEGVATAFEVTTTEELARLSNALNKIVEAYGLRNLSELGL